jgi:hypothetical protein
MEKLALNRNGPPASSPSLISNSGMPLTSIGISQFANVTPPNTTVGW